MNIKLNTVPPSAISLAFLKMAISSIPYPYWQVFLSSPLNLGFNQGDYVTAVRAAVSQGLAGIWSCGCGKCFWWVCAFFYWNHMLVAHTKSRHRLQEWSANPPQHGCHGEASKEEGEPIYSPISHVHSWGVSGAWEGFVHHWNTFFFSQFKKLHSQSQFDWNVCTSAMNMLVFSNLHQMGWYHAIQSFLDNKVNCLG